MRALLSLVGLLLLFAGTALAQTISPSPSLLNFQGRLTRSDGTPVADGNYTLRFSLHNAVSGGTEFWNQTLSPVTVKNGMFATLLNVGTGFRNGATAATLFSSDLWLEIKIGSDPPLTPWQPLVSVAYALKANSVPDGSIENRQIADNAVNTAKIAAGAVTADKFAANVLNPLAWLLGGNSGTTPASHFLGTKDNQPLVFRTNNSEKMRLLPEGNLGIGVGLPSHRLTVATPTGAALRLIGPQDSVGYGAMLNFGDANFVYLKEDEDDKLTIYADQRTAIMGGPVGIGTTSPSGRLQVNTTGDAGASLVLEHFGSNFVVRPFSAGSNGTVIENTAGALYINSRSGVYGLYTNVAFTVNSAGFEYALATDGNVSINGECWVDGDAQIFGDLSVGGTAYADAFLLNSDARYKTNIQTLTDPLATILNLRGVSYDWKDSCRGKGRQIGFIAQEVESVLPEIVHTRADGYKAVGYQNVVPVLVEAVKILKRDNDAVKAENRELKERLDGLTKAIAELKAHVNASK